ncbi:MAG: LytTR family transcriptional regulator [Bacteroidales bacterium]|nr:LytTR family transcriptional regulator [Bacteroidales bacterium]
MNVLQLPVRVVNYVALGVVALGLTIGMGYSIEFLFFDEEYRTVFYALIPVRIFSSVLVYLLILLLCLKYEKEQEKNDEENNDRNPEHENSRNESENSRNETDKTSLIERIAVKSGSKIHVVPIAEVICLLADGDYVQVVTDKGKFLKEQTMKYFETQLPENQFIRVHRSCIVNVEAISRIELYEKQSQQLMLKNGDKIKLSQAGYKLLREKLRL